MDYYDPFLNYGMAPLSGTAGVSSWQDDYYTLAPQCGAGAPARWQGVGGAFPDNNFSSPTLVPTPSLTLAQVAVPAGMTLITDAGFPDWLAATWGPDPAISTCFFWQSQLIYPEYNNVPGGPGQRFGPLARHLQQIRTYNQSLRDSGGQLNVIFADGHAKSLPVLSYFATRATTDGQRVYRYLWPAE